MSQNLLREVLITVRGLLRSPSFALITIFTFAIGIGACAAVFAVVNSVLLRPLPFDSPDRIALLQSLNRDATGKVEEYGSSMNDFLDWRERSRSFVALGAMQPTEVAVTNLGDAEQFDAGLISANLFDALGVPPFAGRFFTPQEEVENSNVVILSHGLWRRSFGDSQSLVGQTVVIDGRAREVVGIAPPDFFFAAESELWLPMNLSAPREARPPSRMLAVAGRLRDGVLMEEASKEIQTIANQLAREFPSSNAGWSAKALPVREPYVREIRGILWFLFASVSFLLLIVCVNIANLVLVRQIQRRSEVVLRTALGGTRWNLWRQLFLENVLLTVSGGLLGLLISTICLKPIIALNPIVATSPGGNRILNSVAMDFRVFLFVMAVSIAAAIVLSVVPLVRISRINLFDFLKSGGRRASGTVQERRFQRIFVIVQLAISFLLLIGAALMWQTFHSYKQIDPGFKTESLITARLALPAIRYDTHQKRAQFQLQLLDKIKTIPGVTSASTTTRLPLNEFAMTTLLEVDGIPTPDGGFVSNFRRIGPDYFTVLRTPVLEGREFNRSDLEKGMPVAVVSREMAKQLWPSQSALGKRIRRLSQTDKNWRTVIGVVEDVKDSSLTSQPGMTLYTPYLQGSIPSFHLVVRTSGSPEGVVTSLRESIRQIDKDLPLYDIATATELFLRSISRPRFAAYLLGTFALIGIFVAVIGVYGVVSYSTAQRINEIGVRLAIGAQKWSILTLILDQSLRLSLAGILIGFVISLFVERSVTTMWSASARLDIYVITAAIVAFTTTVASILPALRATRTDPVTALRYE